MGSRIPTSYKMMSSFMKQQSKKVAVVACVLQALFASFETFQNSGVQFGAQGVRAEANACLADSCLDCNREGSCWLHMNKRSVQFSEWIGRSSWKNGEESKEMGCCEWFFRGSGECCMKWIALFLIGWSMYFALCCSSCCMF